MKEILNRYDNCLICESGLKTKYYNGDSVNGSFKKHDDTYVLTYHNKSKIHKVVFDKNLQIIENDGYPNYFYLVKHCPNCTSKDLISPPFFTLDKLKDSAMFYMFYVNNRRKESVILLEELFRFTKDDTFYGWHAKYNVKHRVWNTSVMANTAQTQLGNLFVKTMESDIYNKFLSIEEIQTKIDTLQTFS